MSDLLVSATSRVLEAALRQINRPAAWPDPASGFARCLFQAAGIQLPDAFCKPLRPCTPQLFRRAPDLAAFGYMLDETDTNTKDDWAQAFDRLMGREFFPSDRNSFIYSPLELIGIAMGAVRCSVVTDAQRALLLGAINQGLVERQFVELTSQVAAACAERLLNGREENSVAARNYRAVDNLQTSELLFLTSLAIFFPDRAVVDVITAEQEILARTLSRESPTQDIAEAAALYVSLSRAINRVVLGAGMNVDPVTKIVALCRRFPLFVERLQNRQRGRPAYTVSDEYDVQDLLHAILKLHFDDVRPEEWTPSYAGNASRIDFLLPQERTIIEAKMTRANLGQKEVANELIIDAARYSKVPHVDCLVCLVYDPLRRCLNPSALEHDLANCGGRLRIAPVVCPRGT